MSVEAYLRKMFSLEGKTVLFTGAAGGIGGEVATGMALAGAHVALCDINMEGLKQRQKHIEELGGKASIFKMDVTDLESIKQTVKEVAELNGRIDVLVNCAGINKREG